MSTASQKKIQEIKTDLFSNDDALVARAISRCEEEGTSELVEPLIAFYASEAPPSLRARVGDLLGTLKVSAVEHYFISALENSAYKHVHKELVGFMWSTGLQPVEAVALLSRLAADGDYFLALECLTLLESIDDTIPEEQLLESIAIMHDTLNGMENSDRKRLLTEYLVALNNLRAFSDENF